MIAAIVSASHSDTAFAETHLRVLTKESIIYPFMGDSRCSIRLKPVS